jgi:sulfoxide reductase heme-binding subunit YedZ
MILDFLNQSKRAVNGACWLLSSMPATYLLLQALNNNLTNNPFAYLVGYTGHWAIAFFAISYAVSPTRRCLSQLAKALKLNQGRRLSDWNFLFYNRRMLGLCSFYYASLHFFIYLNYEIDFDFREFYLEITERTFLSFGLLGWCLLFVLAVTSPGFVQKSIKRFWKTIHRLVHLAAVLLLAHIIYQAKFIAWSEWLYIALLISFAVYRGGYYVAHRRSNDD